jgi:hypothetical protein
MGRIVLRWTGLLAIAVLAFASPAGACGDKFLVIGKGPRRVARAHHPGSILLVLPKGPAATAAEDMRLEATLHEAGHATETVTGLEGLSEALALRRQDAVIVPAEQVSAVRGMVSGAPGAPVLVLIQTTSAPTGQGSALAIQPRSKSLSYLSALDDALGRRRAALAAR